LSKTFKPFRRLTANGRPNPRYAASTELYRYLNGYGYKDFAPTELLSAERQTRNVKRVKRRTPRHAHCRMSFIFNAVCTIVKAYRSAPKLAALEKLHGNSNGTKSACIAAPKDRKHRLINPRRPNDASSLQYFAPRGRLDPTTRIVDSHRPNECSDNKSKS
jgi:hypothetical protein